MAMSPILRPGAALRARHSALAFEVRICISLIVKTATTRPVRVLLVSLVIVLALTTLWHQRYLIKTNWKPRPAVAFFSDEAELRAWAGPDARLPPPEQLMPSEQPYWVEVRRRVELRVHSNLPFWDPSLFERQANGFRLIANLPFSWQPRRASIQAGVWKVDEQDWTVQGWTRSAEVPVNRAEPLIIPARE